MCEYCFYFVGSVLLIDLSNICAENNGDLHVPSEKTGTLQCVVDNTGAIGGNVLIWNTPVSKTKSVIVLFLVLRLFWTLYICCIWVCPSHTIVCDF